MEQQRRSYRPSAVQPTVTLTRCDCGVFYVPGQPHTCDVRQAALALAEAALALAEVRERAFFRSDENEAAAQGDKTDARH